MRARMKRWFPLLRWIGGAIVVLLAGSALWRQLHALSMAELRAAWSLTTSSSIALALLGTTVSLACLAAFEQFATSHVVPGRIPTREALRIGALAHAISNTLGFHALTGGALRYRAYRRLGLGMPEVARIVAVVGLCVGTGVLAVSAMALSWMQIQAGEISHVLLFFVMVILAVVVSRRVIQHTNPAVSSIMVRSAGTVVLLGSVEMAAAIGALYVLLPAGMSPAPFVLLYVGAMLLGIVSHAPGGVGVFEAGILAAWPASQHAQALVALLLYRVLYNLLPFGLAMIGLALRARLDNATRADVLTQFEGG